MFLKYECQKILLKWSEDKLNYVALSQVAVLLVILSSLVENKQPFKMKERFPIEGSHAIILQRL